MDTKNFNHYYDKYSVRPSYEVEEYVEMMKAIFAEHPTLHMAISFGTTPNFNDGDACTHSEYVILLAEDGVFDDYDFLYYLFSEEERNNRYFPINPEDEIGRVGIIPGDEYVKIKLPEALNYKSEDDITRRPESLRRVYTLLGNQPISQSAWGTNYVIVSERQPDGSVTVTHHDHYPNY